MFGDTGSEERAELKDVTPATLRVALCFMGFVFYYILDHYFLATEYYVGGPPFVLLALTGGAGLFFAFRYLKRREPERENSFLYALLLGVGVGLAAHPLFPRVNALLDSEGLAAHPYTLNEELVWVPENSTLPELGLYMEQSEWWRQFEPGDQRDFRLRKGPLGFWQVSMSEIYDEQMEFYGCDGVFSCIFI